MQNVGDHESVFVCEQVCVLKCVEKALERKTCERCEAKISHVLHPLHLKPVSVCMYGGIETFISWEPNSPPWAGMVKCHQQGTTRVCVLVFTCVSMQ